MTTVATLILTAILLGAASAFTSGVLVEDEVTEGVRSSIWGRFPYPGYGEPPPLAPGERPVLSPGSFIGVLITCVRCIGVYSSAVWVAAWCLVEGFPGTTLPEKAVFTVVLYAATCQAQRAWNAATPKKHR